MIALVRSELYRVATIRSSWISLSVFGVLGLAFGWLNADIWQLLAGTAAFALAAMGVAQHYQHRTAVLLHLAHPHRMLVLLGQVITGVLVSIGFAAVSGATTLAGGGLAQYKHTLVVVPIMAVFGAASTAIVRRPTWLFMGYGAWFIFVEGLVGKLDAPLPFSAFINGVGGDRESLLVFAGWTVAALIGAIVAVGRDLSGD